ncbi:hypothetical protein BH10CYA1_BH10CYA1_59310 [soil metagenome]
MQCDLLIMNGRCVTCCALFVGLVLLPVNEQSAVAAPKTHGKATVYSDSCNGKKTANGEIYKSQNFTAASNKLPIGAKVLVRNKSTGKTVIVKINDRMSTKVSAVVDLSKGAAKKLGIKGTGQVDATVIKSGK